MISPKVERFARYLLVAITIATVVVRQIVGPRAGWLVWVALGCTLVVLGLQKLATNRQKQANAGAADNDRTA